MKTMSAFRWIAAVLFLSTAARADWDSLPRAGEVGSIVAQTESLRATSAAAKAAEAAPGDSMRPSQPSGGLIYPDRRLEGFTIRLVKTAGELCEYEASLSRNSKGINLDNGVSIGMSGSSESLVFAVPCTVLGNAPQPGRFVIHLGGALKLGKPLPVRKVESDGRVLWPN